MKNGSLVISLDFELLWGVFDKVDWKQQKDYFLSTRKIIPEILGLFEQYEISCTWATNCKGAMPSNKISLMIKSKLDSWSSILSSLNDCIALHSYLLRLTSLSRIFKMIKSSWITNTFFIKQFLRQKDNNFHKSQNILRVFEYNSS